MTLVLVGLATVYAVAGAYLLHFSLDRLLFAPGPAPAAPGAFTHTFWIRGHDGAAMVVRRFDRAVPAPGQGCVVYFPGRHGGGYRYANDLYVDLEHAGLVVYAIAYPGQDGAPGQTQIDDLQTLAATAVAGVIATCGRTHTVVAGRSLGAMVAAYAAGTTAPAGLVMESASPTLSAGIRDALRQHWFLRPLALLPIARIVRHDFSIAEAVPPELHVVVFQGSADTRTPLADLRPDIGEPARMPIFVVAGGTHADTLQRAKTAMIASMLGMLKGSQEAMAAANQPSPVGRQ